MKTNGLAATTIKHNKNNNENKGFYNPNHQFNKNNNENEGFAG